MEALIILAKSTVILSIFYVLYVAMLKKETFFTANRQYLLAGIIAALLLPFIAFTKTVYLDIPVVTPPLIDAGTMSLVNLEDAQHAAIVPSQTMNWWQVVLIIYAVGVVVMLTRLCIQLASLYRLLHNYPNTKRGHFTYVQINDNIAPFSFFNYICYNPELHTTAELQMIIEHEKVHARQWHTVDVLLAQLLLALQWVNPLAWLFKKELTQNLEFIADSVALQEVHSPKAYQHALVKVSSTALRPALTNQFYHSLIKKRIVMLNKETSHKRNLWKLGLVLPLLGLFMYSFNVQEVIEYREVAPNEKSANEKIMPNKSRVKNTYSLHANLSDAQLLELSKKLEKNATSLKVRFTKATRNAQGELTTIQVETKYPKQLRFYENVTYGGNPQNTIPTIILQIVNDNDLQFQDSGNTMVFKTSIDGVKAELLSKNPRPATPTLGEDPLHIINGQKKSAQEVKGKTFVLDGEIAILGKKEATKTYGAAAQDGAVVYKGQTVVKDEEASPKIEVTTPQKKIKTQDFPAVTLQRPIRVSINKNTTDAQLDALKKELMSDYNIDLSYTLRRNEAYEITSIQISYTGNGKNGNYSISGDAPIEEFFFVMDKDGKMGFWSEQNEARLKERKAQLEERRSQLNEARGERSKAYTERRAKLEEARKERQEALESKREEMGAAMKERSAAMKERLEEKRQALQQHKNALRQNKDTGYVKYEDTTYYFANVNGQTKFYTRFGEEIADTDPLYDKLFKQQSKDFYKDRLEDKSLNLNNFQENPLYILNGVEYNKRPADLDPNNIEDVTVLKGKTATSLYGEKGKNGVVVIVTKN